VEFLISFRKRFFLFFLFFRWSQASEIINWALRGHAARPYSTHITGFYLLRSCPEIPSDYLFVGTYSAYA